MNPRIIYDLASKPDKTGAVSVPGIESEPAPRLEVALRQHGRRHLGRVIEKILRRSTNRSDRSACPPVAGSDA